MNLELVRGLFDGMRPIPRLTVSEWADNYRLLSTTSTAEPGPWRTDRTPYLREIMDRLSANDITQEVIVMKGAQLGLTEAGNNWVGYIVHLTPAPTLMVMPTDETVKRNSKIRIDPMIEATPVLKERIAAARSRDSGNTVLQKEFPGGVLVMTGANSAVGLRSMPVRFLFLDEVDGYKQDLDGEGSPVDLAVARTRTFARRKIFKISTPTLDGVSIIDKEFRNTDQRYFFVPCPHCGGYQHLRWEQMRWEKGQPETARYECEHCNELIEERFKSAMLSNGEWKPTAEDKSTPLKAGYHINSLYSPYGWYSWEQAAREWEDSQNDSNKLKTFVNTVLGLTWKDQGDSPPWENLYNRREDYPTNSPAKDVAFLTAGVDVQKDRLELEIVGWCKGKRSYSIDFRVILGDTSNKDVWDELAKVVHEQWKREDGALMQIRMMAIDSGYNTSHVYEFCKRFDASRVIPTKGQESQATIIAPPRAVFTSRNGKKVATGVKLWNIGVSMIKSELYGWLRLENIETDTPPNGYCHFPQYDQHYFRGLTAEQLQYSVNKRGFHKYEWVKKYERNEPLDCRVYARAAAAVIGMDRFMDHHYDEIAGQYVIEQKQAQTAPPKKKRSSFWD